MVLLDDVFDGLPVSGICRVCGCSDDAACLGGCVWANGDATLCSRCVDGREDLDDDSDDIDFDEDE